MQQHRKSYSHTEFAQKFATFKDNQRYIDEWNAKKNGVTLAMNHMGDLSNAEYRRMYLGTKVDLTQVKGETFVADNSQALPTSFDLRS
jgi:hypothetical protein